MQETFHFQDTRQAPLTWAALLGAYFRARPHLSLASRQTIASTVGPLIEFWGEVCVREFDAESADQFRLWRVGQITVRGTPAPVQAADDTLRRARMLINFAVDRRLIPENPMFGLGRLSRYRLRDITLSESSLERLLSVEFPVQMGPTAPIEFRALLLIMWSSGCRIGEALRIRWRDLRGRFFRIYKQKNGGKAGDLAKLSHQAMAAIERVRTMQKVTKRSLVRFAYIFPAKRGPGCLSYSTAWKRFSWAFEVAKIRDVEPGAVPHSFRHSVASDMVEAGIPLDHVQMILRHTDAKTTRGYVHIRKPLVSATYDRLEDFRDMRRKGPKKIVKKGYAKRARSGTG